MSTPNRFIGSLVLAAALATPIAATTGPAPPKNVSATVRVYDPGRREYRNWDRDENHAWATYESQRHEKAHSYGKSSTQEQADYWNWRRAHPDGKRQVAMAR
jgi:hypothetical protein